MGGRVFRARQDLLAQEVRQPRFVLVGCPSPLTGEKPIQVRVVERPEDVRGAGGIEAGRNAVFLWRISMIERRLS